MAIVYDGQYRAAGTDAWKILFTGILSLTYVWDTTLLPDDSYEWRVRARDDTDGAVSGWATRTLALSRPSANRHGVIRSAQAKAKSSVDVAGRPTLVMRSLPGAALDTADVLVTVASDNGGAGGSLRLWTNPAGDASPDPGTAPEATLSLAGTPATVGPLESAALNEVRSHPAEPKVVYAEFVSTDGRSSGKIALRLTTRLTGLIDRLGALEAGSIHRWSQFADKYQPPLLFATATARTGATGIEEGRRAVQQDDGSEWVYRAGAWVAEALPRNEGFFPALVAGAVKTAYLHADVGNFVDLRADTVATRILYAEVLTALKASIGSLSEIQQNAGIVVQGQLQNDPLSPTAGLNLQAGANQKFLFHPGLDLMGPGSNPLANFRGSVRVGESGTGLEVVNSSAAKLANLAPVNVPGGGGARIVAGNNGAIVEAVATSDYGRVTLAGTDIRLMGPVAHGTAKHGPVGGIFAVNFNMGGFHYIVLAGNAQWALQNPKDGGVYRLIVQQDATGGWTLTFEAREWFPGGTVIQPSPAAHSVTIYEYQYQADIDKYLVHVPKRDLRPAGGGAAPAPSGPAAAPTAMQAADSSFCVSGSATLQIDYSFTAGDTTADTKIYVNNVHVQTLSAGTTAGTVGVSATGSHTVEAAHIKNGAETTRAGAIVDVFNPCGTAII